MAPVEERSAGRTSPRRAALAVRFCGVFLGLLALYAAVHSAPLLERWVHAPASRAVALSCLPVLSVIGDASLSGTFLQFEDFHARVADACNGVLPTWIFLSAVIAFPSRFTDKLRGFLLGIPALFVVNVVRVTSLMVLGAYEPNLVDRIHIDVWQTAVVVLAMGIWIFWAERTVRRQPALRG